MTKKYKKFLIIEAFVLLIIVAICIIINTDFFNKIPKCLILQNFNVICPSCGGTRCVEQFFKGNFYQAFVYNKLFFILLIYGSILNLLYIINTIKNSKQLMWIYPKTWHIYLWTLVLIVYTITRNI